MPISNRTLGLSTAASQLPEYFGRSTDEIESNINDVINSEDVTRRMKLYSALSQLPQYSGRNVSEIEDNLREVFAPPEQDKYNILGKSLPMPRTYEEPPIQPPYQEPQYPKRGIELPQPKVSARQYAPAATTGVTPDRFVPTVIEQPKPPEQQIGPYMPPEAQLRERQAYTPTVAARTAGKTIGRGLAEAALFPVEIGGQFFRGIPETRKVGKKAEDIASKVRKFYEYTPEEEQAIKEGGLSAAVVVGVASAIPFVAEMMAMGSQRQAAAIIKAFVTKYGAKNVAKTVPMWQQALGKEGERILSDALGMGEVSAATTPGGIEERIKAGGVGAATGALAFGVPGALGRTATKGASPVIKEVAARTAMGAGGAGAAAVQGAPKEEIATQAIIGGLWPGSMAEWTGPKRTPTTVAERPRTPEIIIPPENPPESPARQPEPPPVVEPPPPAPWPIKPVPEAKLPEKPAESLPEAVAKPQEVKPPESVPEEVPMAEQETQLMPVVQKRHPSEVSFDDFMKMSPEEQRQNYESIQNENLSNPVTGTPGQKSFDITFKNATENYTKPVTVGIGDLNGLKEYNDILVGMGQANKLLKTVQEYIAKESSDIKVSHLHGDEYAVVSSLNPEETQRIIANALGKLSSDIKIEKDGVTYRPTMSWIVKEAASADDVGKLNPKSVGRNKIGIEKSDGNMYNIIESSNTPEEQQVYRGAHENSIRQRNVVWDVNRPVTEGQGDLAGKAAGKNIVQEQGYRPAAEGAGAIGVSGESTKPARVTRTIHNTSDEELRKIVNPANYDYDLSGFSPKEQQILLNKRDENAERLFIQEESKQQEKKKKYDEQKADQLKRGLKKMFGFGSDQEITRRLLPPEKIARLEAYAEKINRDPDLWNKYQDAGLLENLHSQTGLDQFESTMSGERQETLSADDLIQWMNEVGKKFERRKNKGEDEDLFSQMVPAKFKDAEEAIGEFNKTPMHKGKRTPAARVGGKIYTGRTHAEALSLGIKMTEGREPSIDYNLYVEPDGSITNRESKKVSSLDEMPWGNEPSFLKSEQQDLFGRLPDQGESERQAAIEKQKVKEKLAETKGGEAELTGLPLFRGKEIAGTEQQELSLLKEKQGVANKQELEKGIKAQLPDALKYFPEEERGNVKIEVNGNPIVNGRSYGGGEWKAMVWTDKVTGKHNVAVHPSSNPSEISKILLHELPGHIRSRAVYSNNPIIHDKMKVMFEAAEKSGDPLLERIKERYADEIKSAGEKGKDILFDEWTAHNLTRYLEGEKTGIPQKIYQLFRSMLLKLKIAKENVDDVLREMVKEMPIAKGSEKKGITGFMKEKQGGSKLEIKEQEIQKDVELTDDYVKRYGYNNLDHFKSEYVSKGLKEYNETEKEFFMRSVCGGYIGGKNNYSTRKAA